MTPFANPLERVLDPQTLKQQLDELRANWRLAAVTQFLFSFREAFGIDDICTEDLELALIGTLGDAYLTDLFWKLLRGLTMNRNITFQTWQAHLDREFRTREPANNPFEAHGAVQLYDLPLADRLFALHRVCEWQLHDPERFRRNFKEEEKDAKDWRVDPIGRDSRGCSYWLFDDNRLYKETPVPWPPKSKPAKRNLSRHADDPPQTKWELSARTADEWKALTASFDKPRGSNERDLAEVLNDLCPAIVDAWEKSAKERKLQEAIASRKRSSRILVKELEKAEEERRLVLEERRKREEAESRNVLLATKRDDQERLQREMARMARTAEREKRLQNRERRNQQRSRTGSVTPLSDRSSAAGADFAGDLDIEGDLGSDVPQQEEEGNWLFDCVCGVRGENLDDGQHMIACEACGVWQHSSCLQQAGSLSAQGVLDWQNLTFVCDRCREWQRDPERVPGPSPVTPNWMYDINVTPARTIGPSDAAPGVEGGDQAYTRGISAKAESAVDPRAAANGGSPVSAKRPRLAGPSSGHFGTIPEAAAAAKSTPIKTEPQ